MASGATCVQRLDGSRDSAIHTKYRISLRSSSMREPRYPLPRVVLTYRIRRTPNRTPSLGRQGSANSLDDPWRGFAPGFVCAAEKAAPVHRQARHRIQPTDQESPRPKGPEPPVCFYRFTGRSARQVSTMILPQVHLRKPCYDFSFL
jgi:hypothetical protein